MALIDMLTTAFTDGGYDLLNAKTEAEKAAQTIQADQIAIQEGQNALSGMRVNLGNNQMRRYNATQQAMGQIG